MAGDPMALRTAAWLLKGTTGSLPGALELAGDRLAFTTEEGRVFETPLHDVEELTFPWYYFGGGMKLSVGGDRYRLSFVKPNAATDVPAALLGEEGDERPLLLTSRLPVLDIGRGRGAGRAWKQALTARLTG